MIAIVVAGAVGLSTMMVAPEVPLQRPTPQRPVAPQSPPAAPPATTAPAEAPVAIPPSERPAAPAAEPIAIPEAPAPAEPVAPAHPSAQTEAELAADEAEFSAPNPELDLTGVHWVSNETEAERNRELARARTMVAAGAVAGVGSLLMIIAAGVEGAKPGCDFGLDDCADAPRTGLAAGLGVTGGVLAAGGAALLTVGGIRLRRLNTSVRADRQSALVSLRGRF